MRPRVHTRKHYVQQSIANVAASAIAQFKIVEAVQDVGVGTVPFEVIEGAVISAVYCEIWITSGDAAQATAIVTLEKLQAGATNMTTTESGLLNSYDNKKNVFYTFMGLVAPNVQVATPSIRAWMKIPKSKQRFGLGDKFVLNVHGQSNDVNLCGFFTFKEQL